MAYLAFARKYRPQDFTQVVGQDEAVAALTKALEDNRLHHAYIFSGTRGVGKTTLARILAKSLNCLEYDGPTVKPCGKCASCTDIAAGKSIDVIEIDGASNTGVDNIRELRESVKFAPSYSRYKVYIIDEVHRISQQAFDALLKTLEEPPAHVKFVFATTELNKVPITILSRCQKFTFNLVSRDNIIKKLKYIAECEGITVDDDIYRYIAKASLGSIRDSESIFDQIVPLLSSGADFEGVLDVLGEIKEFAILDFVEALFKKDSAKALTMIDDVIKQGKDLEKYVDNIIEVLRNVMLTKLLKDSAKKVVELPDELQNRTNALAAAIDPGFIVRAIDSFIDIKRVSRYIDSMRIPFEVAVVRLMYAKPAAARPAAARPAAAQAARPAQPAAAPRPQASPAPQPRPAANPAPNPAVKPMAQATPASPSSAPQAATSQQAKPTAPLGSVASVFNEFAPAAKATNNNAQPAVNAGGTLNQANLANVWQQCVATIAKNKVILLGVMNVAKVVAVKGRSVVIGFPRNCAFQKETFERQANKEYIEQVFMRALGCEVKFLTQLLDETIAQEAPKNTAAEFVNDVMDAFGGEMI